MGKYENLVFQILRGMSDANIAFADLVSLLKHLGFDMRIKGSYHVLPSSREVGTSISKSVTADQGQF